MVYNDITKLPVFWLNPKLCMKAQFNPNSFALTGGPAEMEAASRTGNAAGVGNWRRATEV